MSDWSDSHEEREVIVTPRDKQRVGLGGMPRHEKGRDNDAPPKRPVLWNVQPVEDFAPPPVWGMFPRGFIDLAIQHLGCAPSEVLHVCSGGLSRRDVRGGTRVDISRTSRPDVVADGRSLPFPDRSFSGVLIDPPYSVEYAGGLYACD